MGSYNVSVFGNYSVKVKDITIPGGGTKANTIACDFTDGVNYTFYMAQSGTIGEVHTYHKSAIEFQTGTITSSSGFTCSFSGQNVTDYAFSIDIYTSKDNSGGGGSDSGGGDQPTPDICSIPRNLTISPQSAYVNEQVYVDWDAPYEGNVDRYKIKVYVNGSDPTTVYSKYSNYNCKAASFSAKKGDTLGFKVMAESSDGYEYHSDYTSLNNIKIINSPPSTPSISCSGIVTDSNSKVTITGLNSTDDDNDSLTYYYKITSDASRPTTGWSSPFTPSGNQYTLSGLTPTFRYVHIRISDGSTSKYTYIEANYSDPPPEFTSFTLSGENISTVGGSVTATRSVNISASFNKSVKYKVWLKFPNSGYLKLFDSSEQYTSSINTNSNIEEIGSSYRGQEISIKIDIKDSSGRPNTETVSLNSILATETTEIPELSGSSNRADFYQEEASDFLGNSIKLSFSIPGQNTNDIPWQKIDICMKKHNGEYIVLESHPFTNSMTSINVSNQVYSIKNKLNINYSYEPAIIITDIKGRESIKNSGQLFSILPVLKISNDSLCKVSLNNWEVYTSPSIAFSLQNLQVSAGVAKYHIYGQVEGGERRKICIFNNGQSGVKILNNTITYSITGLDNLWDLFKTLGVPSNQPKKRIYYSVKIENNAKVESPDFYQIPGTYYITSQTSPSWSGNAILKRGYSKPINSPLASASSSIIQSIEKDAHNYLILQLKDASNFNLNGYCLFNEEISSKKYYFKIINKNNNKITVTLEDGNLFTNEQILLNKTLIYLGSSIDQNVIMGYSNDSINEGELLSFEFTNAPEDKNDNFYNGMDESTKQTLQKISLEYFINSTGNLTINDSNATQYSWSALPGEKKTSEIYGDSGLINKKVFQILLPHIFIPKDNIYYLYIRAKAEDDTGNFVYKYATNNLIAGRCEKADYMLTIPNEGVIYDENKQALDLKLNFMCSDYGGNKKSFSNFNRQESKGKSKLYIKCAASLQELEKTPEKIYEYNDSFIPDLSNGEISFHYENISLNGKIYIEAKLQVEKYQEDIQPIITQNPIITLYLNGPTISVRPHSIGINEGNLNLQEAVAVSAFNEKQFVVLRGINNSSAVEVKFNLNTGEVFGAILDGGSW